MSQSLTVPNNLGHVGVRASPLTTGYDYTLEQDKKSHKNVIDDNVPNRETVMSNGIDTYVDKLTTPPDWLTVHCESNGSITAVLENSVQRDESQNWV